MQPFWIDLFGIFDVSKRRVATYFERRIGSGFADLFWKEVLLVEQKSLGKDLEMAKEQALRYCDHITSDEMPRYVIACDFQRFVINDLDENKTYKFMLSELPDRIKLFNFIQGKIIPVVCEDPVNRKASVIMAKISNELAGSGYDKKDLGYFLTRLTYCMFADDTEIFTKNLFHDYVFSKTAKDGSDVGIKIKRIFEILNTPSEKRQKAADEDLNSFPYIDGDLFKNEIRTPEFSAALRNLLIEASNFDWSKVSPAIFGNLFQGVMSPEARRDEGAHYTTEENILKVINPLFMDSLKAEYRKIKNGDKPYRKSSLKQFQDKLSKLKFLDPACGSGNFLIIAYREIRRLELSVIRELHNPTNQLLDVSKLSKVNVDQFYGIEINDFSAKIAETSLWMMDHLMNRELGSTYGMTYARIPLTKHPRIICRDALDYDWNKLLPSSKCSYVFGNPPYSGAKKQTDKNRSQIERLVGKGRKDLDYVSGWFIKASQYITPNTDVGFVATNSITQGEQVGLLWPLLERTKVDIIFAHRQFRWGSDAQGMAKVFVVIVGLSKRKHREKRLIESTGTTSIQEYHKFISPYLIGSSKKLPIAIASNKCLSNLPQISFGTMSIDGGHYIFEQFEKDEFLEAEPAAKKFFRKFVSGKDLINGKNRWILDLEDAKPSELKSLPLVCEKINQVVKFRKESKRKETVKLAQTPRKFAYRPKINSDKFIVIPRTTSAKRQYVPITMLTCSWIPSDANMIVDSSDPALFGLLVSKMHITWLRLVGGRLKNDLRYSEAVVYNTFPVPNGDISSLRVYGQTLLDIRQKHHDQSLKGLYDPTCMPSDLMHAHVQLDSAVDRLYRRKKFETIHERMEYLLDLYANICNPSYTF